MKNTLKKISLTILFGLTVSVSNIYAVELCGLIPISCGDEPKCGDDKNMDALCEG